MSFEPDDLEPIDERTAALARDVLRATDVAGLDAAMRAQIAERAARRSQPRLWPLVLAAALGGAFVVALGLYYGVVEPARLAEQQARAEMIRLAAEREAERERVAMEQQHQLAVEAAKAAQAQAQVRALAAAEAANAAQEMEKPSASPLGAGSDWRRPAAMHGGKSSGRARPSAASTSAGGCDPDDPLCGL
jgi:hypothetical protein